jgi:hypothetical protein
VELDPATWTSGPIQAANTADANGSTQIILFQHIRKLLLAVSTRGCHQLSGNLHFHRGGSLAGKLGPRAIKWKLENKAVAESKLKGEKRERDEKGDFAEQLRVHSRLGSKSKKCKSTK